MGAWTSAARLSALSPPHRAALSIWGSAARWRCPGPVSSPGQGMRPELESSLFATCPLGKPFSSFISSLWPGTSGPPVIRSGSLGLIGHAGRARWARGQGRKALVLSPRPNTPVLQPGQCQARATAAVALSSRGPWATRGSADAVGLLRDDGGMLVHSGQGSTACRGLEHGPSEGAGDGGRDRLLGATAGPRLER